MTRIFSDRHLSSLLPVLLLSLLFLPGAGEGGDSSLLAQPARRSGETSRRDPNSGKPLFEEAYSLEKSDPRKAIRLYQEALQEGLDQKMTAAARWRLFYLYREEKEWGAAYSLSFHLGNSSSIQSVRDSMKKSMQRSWRVSSQAIDEYLEALQALHGEGGAPATSTPEMETPFRTDYLNYFYRAIRLSPDSLSFRREILERLVQAGRSEEALQLIETVSTNTPEERYQMADLLYNVKQRDRAARILEELASDETVTLERDDKFKILYLMGRIQRDRGNLHEAVAYFRLASSYARSEEALRQLALASYALYRKGMALQALALLRDQPVTEDANVHLLSMILRAEVDDDPEAIQELLDRKEKIVQMARSTGGGSFLIKRALRIITKNES